MKKMVRIFMWAGCVGLERRFYHPGNSCMSDYIDLHLYIVVLKAFTVISTAGNHKLVFCDDIETIMTD